MGSERDPGLVEPVRDTTRRVCRPDREGPDEPSGPVQLSDLNPIAEAAAASRTSARGATKACVVLEGDGERVRLSVSDDGRGLPEPLIAGVGLTAMRERAEELGGTVDVARQGDWTTVVVELPMRAAGG